MFKTISKQKRRLLFAIIADCIIIAAYILGDIFFKEYVPFIENDYVFFSVCTFCIILPIVVAANAIKVNERQTRKNYIKIANTLGADISEAYLFGEIGIVTYNDHRDIIWTSDLFDDRNIKIMGLNVLDKFPKLEPFFLDEHRTDPIVLTFAKRKYSVMHLPELSVLIFKDVTDIEDLYLRIEEDMPVVCTILFDDLSNIISITHDEEYQQIENAARKLVLDWAKENNVLLKRIKDDIYVGMMHESTYETILNGRFAIVKEVANISQGKDVSYTISLGFGRGINDFVRLSDLSAAAIDIAQSRGGNQTVVNNYAGHVEFYGGEGAENKTTRHSIKNRVLAQSFFAQLQTFDNVFVIPHVEADFDAVGACLGVECLCKALNKNCYMIAEKKQLEMKARIMLEDTVDAQHLKEFMIPQKEALSMLNENCICVAVDVNRMKLTTAPKLLEQATKVAVIDHHRKSEDTIDNPIFSHVDSQASSACEMITEMINDIPANINVPSNVATYMLAGILLDTQNFKAKVSAATFKTCMILKELDAEEDVANSYLKDEYEEYVLKSKVLSNMESPYFGVMLGCAPSNEIVDKATLGKISNEACDLKDVRASFVLGYIEKDCVGISARSNGRFNVQLIMEKMGGGGHHSQAAAQIQNSTIEKVKAQLLDILEIFLSDVED